MNRNEPTNTLMQRVYKLRTASTPSASVVQPALVPLPRQPTTGPPEERSSNSATIAPSERRNEAESALKEKKPRPATVVRASAEKAKQTNKKSAAKQKADCMWRECKCEPDNPFYVDGARSYFRHCEFINAAGAVVEELESGDLLKIFNDTKVYILIGMYRPNGGEVSLHVVQEKLSRSRICVQPSRPY